VPPLSELLSTHPEIWGTALVRDPDGTVWFEGLYVDLTSLSYPDKVFWTAQPYRPDGPERSYWQFMWIADPTMDTKRRRVIRVWWA